MKINFHFKINKNMSEFDKLPKDVLIETVLNFEVNDVYQFCATYPQYQNNM